jgi:hypothetical protein
MGRKLEVEIFGTVSNLTSYVTESVSNNGGSLLHLAVNSIGLKPVTELEWHWITLGGDHRRTQKRSGRLYSRTLRLSRSRTTPSDAAFFKNSRLCLTNVCTKSTGLPRPHVARRGFVFVIYSHTSVIFYEVPQALRYPSTRAEGPSNT